MLELRDISYRYPGDEYDTADGLSFSVKRGSFNCILGVSGCGKSTVFRLINGLLKPQKGAIFIDGKDASTLKMRCGYMPQKDMLFPWRSVGDNVMLPLEVNKALKNCSKTKRRELACKALKDVGLEDCYNKMPDELSGGMRQRAAFARTMLTGNELLLLDEPFSALDFLTRISMQEWLLEQWEKHHKTILFITHDVDEALFLSSGIFVVEETPIKSLKEIIVPAGRPRSRQILDKPEIIELKNELINILRRQQKV